MTRREIRENLYIMLFRLEFHDKDDLSAQAEMCMEDMVGLREKDRAELIGKFNGVVDNLDVIDAKIEQMAKGWTIGRIAKAELTILRLAIYEIMYDENVPDSVAINEAIELSKSYGGDKASGFINGILSSVVRERSQETE